MGSVNMGISVRESRFFQNLMGLSVAIETGTYHGGTSRELSEMFDKVYTIEKSNIMFDIARSNLQHIPNVTQYLGDSTNVLPEIVEDNDNILYWLDAHYSGGDTAQGVCPLLKELEIIFSHNKNQMILIDDVRLFGRNNNELGYEHQIINAIPTDWGIIDFEDVYYVYPKKFETEITNHFSAIGSFITL